MSRRPLFPTLLAVLAFCVPGAAQLIRCETAEHNAALMQQDPKFAARHAEIELATAAYVAAHPLGEDVVRTIPVVFHVVYNTAAENLPDAQILSQLLVLNEDFRRTNADAAQTRAAFLPVAADSEIQFCLATSDPLGAPTTGITRTATATTSFGSSGNPVKFTASGGRDAWPAANYLNVWICDLSSGLLGYAQFPGGAAATDGVVVDYQCTGRNYPTNFAAFNLGRSATHEVGHWLNLIHIWGDSSTCGIDDAVADTPDANAPTGGCPFSSTITQCGVSIQYENYMDYTDDPCMNMFSAGQKVRMQALFNAGGFRASLLNSLGCGVAVPQFQVNQTHSSLTNDGLAGTSGTPAISSKCTGQAGTLVFSSAAANVGLPYDTAVSFLPLVSATGGGITVNNQIVNVQLATAVFVSSGTATPLLPPWPGTFSVPYTAPGPSTISLQKIQFTPSVIGGFALSQGVQIVTTSGGTFPAGPTADDSSVTITLGGATCASNIAFYGTSYASFAVISNGRCQFGSPVDVDFSPTVAEALADAPFVGFWTDLNPATGGSISITSPGANLVRVNYTNVPYYGTTVLNSFAIEFNTSTNTVTLDNLLPINANTAAASTSTRQFLGISRGLSVATNNGETAFAPGGSGPALAANAMIYQFYNNTGGGLVSSLATTALNRIVLTPSGGNYTWAGF